MFHRFEKAVHAEKDIVEDRRRTLPGVDRKKLSLNPCRTKHQACARFGSTGSKSCEYSLFQLVDLGRTNLDGILYTIAGYALRATRHDGHHVKVCLR
jgi:hypothetical protein